MTSSRRESRRYAVRVAAARGMSRRCRGTKVGPARTKAWPVAHPGSRARWSAPPAPRWSGRRGRSRSPRAARAPIAPPRTQWHGWRPASCRACRSRSRAGRAPCSAAPAQSPPSPGERCTGAARDPAARRLPRQSPFRSWASRRTRGGAVPPPRTTAPAARLRSRGGRHRRHQRLRGCGRCRRDCRPRGSGSEGHRGRPWG